MIDKIKFNDLVAKSKNFDDQYCCIEAFGQHFEETVLLKHQEIITGFNALISSALTSREKGNVYNNIHVQFEGLRKYYGICFDRADEDAKHGFLDKQIELNLKCQEYAQLQSQSYTGQADKRYADAYLAEYKDFYQILRNVGLELSTHQVSDNEEKDSEAGDEIPLAPPSLQERSLSFRGQKGVDGLMSLNPQSVIERAWHDLTMLCTSGEHNLPEESREKIQQAIHLLGSCTVSNRAQRNVSPEEHSVANSLLSFLKKPAGDHKRAFSEVNAISSSNYSFTQPKAQP